MPVVFATSTTAVANGAATSTLSVPSGTVNGDMLLAVVCVGEAVGVTPTISGFTQKRLHNGVQDGAGYDFDITLAMFWRRASSEPASYTVNNDGTYGQFAAMTMLRYTGVVSTGDPFRTVGSVSRTNSAGASQTSVALSGVQATDLAIHADGTALGSWNTTAFALAGPGGGWVERGAVYMSTNSTAKPGVLCVEQVGTGAAPAIAATGTAGANARSVFVAGALISEPAPASRPEVVSTAVRRASTW